MVRPAFRRTLAPAAIAALLGSAWAWAGEEPGGAAAPRDVPAFHHLHLNTADPLATVRFYEQQFPTSTGTTVAAFPGVRTGHVLLLFSKARRPASPTPQSAYWHFGWHVPSASGYWERYRSTGAPLVPLHTPDGTAVTFSGEWLPGTLTREAAAAARERGGRSPAGGVGYGYLRGPDGELVEFQGNLPAERFNHVHMFQEDVFCAELWYARHLHAPLSESARRAAGRKTSESDCRVTKGEPSWLSLVPEGTVRVPAGGVAFGDVEMNWYQRQGTEPLASSRGGVMDHVGLQVRNLDAWVRRLRRGGVKVLKRPYRFGNGRAVLVEGPSREAIELLEVP